MRQKELGDYQCADEHSCPQCDRSFTTRSGLGRHHAAKHGEKLPKRTVPCTQCGVVVEREKWQIERQDTWFCSTDCHGQWQSENLTGENHPDYDPDAHITHECDYCSDMFEGQTGNPNNYCSHECRSQANAMLGEDNPTWKPKVELTCGNCKSEFKVTPARSSAKYCSWECASEAKSEVYGPDHPLWKCGRDVYRSIRNALGPKSWGRLSAETRSKLGHECGACGKSAEENGRSLSAHHIVPVMYGGDNGDYNLMALCQGCHHKVEQYTKAIPEVEPVLLE